MTLTLQPCTLRVKNYRCFADEAPLEIQIAPGFTAFVGPNNSGKSTLLRLFYELRSLFASLGQENNLANFSVNGAIQAGAMGIDDSMEVFHNRNERPLSLDLELPITAEHQLRRVVVTTSRQEPHIWRGHLLDQNGRGLKKGGGSGNMMLFEPEGANRHYQYSVMSFLDMARAVSNSMYVGPFRNALNEGAGQYFDMQIGTSFIAQWDAWKSGTQRTVNELTHRITDDLRHIFGYERLEIGASSDNKTLQLYVDGKPYRLRELGGGFAQFTVVLASVAMRRPDLLLIDEPELNLHPSLQADFLTSLASYAKHGVLFATHSVGLARTLGERIYSFRREGNHSVVKPFGQDTHFAEFLGEMSFSSFKELGHDSILLAEGVTEVRTMQQFLRKLGLDHKVVVIPLGGDQLIRGNRVSELSELGRLSNNIAVIIDSERAHATSALEPYRSAFLRACDTLKFRTHTTDLRAIENYFTDQSIAAIAGSGVKALSPFEKFDGRWSKADNWRLAREMTKHELMATDVGQFLSTLV
jgi:predicted ATPase